MSLPCICISVAGFFLPCSMLFSLVSHLYSIYRLIPHSGFQNFVESGGFPPPNSTLQRNPRSMNVNPNILYNGKRLHA